MEYFNKLTPDEHERLAWLMEECAEVQQAIGKILRHGYESFDPTNPLHKGNRFDLCREIIDVLKAIELMVNKGDLQKHESWYQDRLFEIYFEKNYIPKYMHHQEKE